MLKNGQRLQATIVSEQADHYVLMVQVTETIRDQRKIAKTEIQEIITDRPDQDRFEAIAELVPTPDGLDLADYDQRMTQIRDFVESFPSSGHLDEARRMLEILGDERTVVADGGIKFDGRMLSASEREASAYTLDSQMVAARIEEAAEANQRIAALRAWDELESQFPNSRACVETAPIVLRLMRQQQAAIDRSLGTLDQRLEERQKNLERVPIKDRRRVEAEIQRQASDYQRRVAAEKEAGIRWLQLNPFDKDSLTAAKRLLESEIRRLESTDWQQRPDGDQVWKETWATLNRSPNAMEARAALQAASQAGLGKLYLEKLEALVPKP